MKNPRVPTHTQTHRNQIKPSVHVKAHHQSCDVRGIVGNLYHEHIREALWFVNNMIIRNTATGGQTAETAPLSWFYGVLGTSQLVWESLNQIKPDQTGLSCSFEPFGGEIKQDKDASH